MSLSIDFESTFLVQMNIIYNHPATLATHNTYNSKLRPQSKDKPHITSLQTFIDLLIISTRIIISCQKPKPLQTSRRKTGRSMIEAYSKTTEMSEGSLRNFCAICFTCKHIILYLDIIYLPVFRRDVCREVGYSILV
jgi:hypothetical protein